MSASRTTKMTVRTGLAVSLALLIGGCGYDSSQRTARVGFSAGDAVKANLEAATTDPSDHTMYETTGLGKDGAVVEGDPAAP